MPASKHRRRGKARPRWVPPPYLPHRPVTEQDRAEDAELPPWVRRGWIRVSRRGAHGDPLHAGPCFGRGAVAQARMQTYPVVKDLDILEDRRLRLGAGAVAGEVDVLGLERGEEALHRSVVQRVAAPAHGLHDAIPLEDGPVRP
jgi:hypothetical protein